MNIYVKNTEEQYLVVEFTEDDLKNELLDSTVKSILENYGGELIEGVLHITPHYDQQKPNIGQLIDEIREQLIGDVVQEFEEQEVILEEAVIDLKGKIIKPAVTKTELIPIEKDLSKCPCLSFTAQKVVESPLEVKEEPIEEPVEEPIEKPLEEVLDGKMETKTIQ